MAKRSIRKRRHIPRCKGKHVRATPRSKVCNLCGVVL